MKTKIDLKASKIASLNCFRNRVHLACRVQVCSQWTETAPSVDVRCMWETQECWQDTMIIHHVLPGVAGTSAWALYLLSLQGEAISRQCRVCAEVVQLLPASTVSQSRCRHEGHSTKWGKRRQASQAQPCLFMLYHRWKTLHLSTPAVRNE